MRISTKATLVLPILRENIAKEAVVYHRRSEAIHDA